MGTLEISLLGGFLLKRDGVPLAPIASRAGRSLLAFLVMNRERAHTRDLLAGAFWPDLPDSRARRRLSQALWQVQARIGGREVLERPLVITTGDTVRFDPGADFRLDVEEFERTLQQASAAASSSRAEEGDLLAAAVRLYRGHLLDGFYDDWALPDREQLRERFLGALERLTDLVMSRGDYETALIHARRLAQHDPLREEAHRRVMRLAALLGRHNDAIRQYEVCRRILADELGAKPAAATREIYEATLAERESEHRTPMLAPGAPLFEPAGQVPLVGRDQERLVLVRLLDAALEGHGGLILVEGEPGVGKTRLLAEAAGDARWRGMDVLWGRSSPSGGRPYAPFAEALVSGTSPLRARQLAQRLEPAWREPLAQLVPALADAGAPPAADPPMRPTDEQARMRESIALAVLGLASIVPVLVVLEDVHWADQDTIQALAHLAGRTEGHRIVIAVSYRHADSRERSEVWGLLRSLDQRPSCSRLSLRPCSPAQTEELMRCCLGLPEVAAEFSRRVHRETGGVPLFIIEALRAQYEQGDLDETADHESARPGASRLPLTPTVHALIRTRLSGLTPDARAILDLVSVHDGELTLAEIIAAGDLPNAAVLQGVDELARRGLLAEGPGGYQVAHEPMRRVAYEDLPPSSRLALHRRVALTVEGSRPDQVEMLAHHFSTAGMPDRAAVYLEKAAARALSVRAYDTAAFHLARATEALDQVDAPPARRFQVAARHEEVLDVLARRADQEAALERMARYASEDETGDVHRRRAWWLAHQDRFLEAEAEARLALDLARVSADSGRAVAALSTLGMIACFAGRASDGVVFLEQAATFRGADRRRQADARNALGQNLIDLQRFDEAEPQLLAALALYGELHDARGQAEVHGMLGTLRMERGESELAEADFTQAIEMSRAIGYRHGEAVYQMNLGILFVIRNRLGAALAAFDRAARIYSDINNGRGRALVLANAAWIRHASLGDDERAERDATEACGVYEQIGDIRGRAQCLVILGSIQANRGALDEGRRLLEEGVALTQKAEDVWLAAQALRELASVELAAGLATDGVAHASEAERLCQQTGMNDLRVGIKALLGRLLLETGEIELALEQTGEAIAGFHPGIELAYKVPFAHALALAAAGRGPEADHFLEMACQELYALLSDLPDDAREEAVTAVPAHREIVAAWNRRRPRRTEHRLARKGPLSGQPLNTGKRVAVTWTVHLSSDDDLADPRERRQRQLLRLLTEAAEQGGAPTVDDLAGALEVSVATLRRDLVALRRAGHPAVTRGTRSQR